MVCFDRGRPNKSAYRKYKIKTVAGVDDFASMAEVVGRRYRRVKREKIALAGLDVNRRGAGQLSAAERALAEVTDRKIPWRPWPNGRRRCISPAGRTPSIAKRLSRASIASTGSGRSPSVCREVSSGAEKKGCFWVFKRSIAIFEVLKGGLSDHSWGRFEVKR
jgi:hypothetical protein